MKKYYIVFDVESVGLHGEGFAVGYVVVSDDGQEHDFGLYSCLPSLAVGDPAGLRWVIENIPTLPVSHTSPGAVRAAFWTKWDHWKHRYAAMLAADVPWPVEARFLHQCLQDDPGREYDGPYPLIDIASVMIAVGRDPLATYDRRDAEVPAHNPLADARQSARLLLECLAAKHKTL